MQSETATQTSNNNGTIITETSKIIAGENASVETDTPVFALKEYGWCTLKAMTWPDGKTPKLIVDDGEDAILSIHKGYAGEKDPALFDSPPDNKELQIIQ
jgi:adenosylhomocysteinase